MSRGASLAACVQVLTMTATGLKFSLLYRVALPGGSALPDAADVILHIPDSSTGALQSLWSMLFPHSPA